MYRHVTNLRLQFELHFNGTIPETWKKNLLCGDFNGRILVVFQVQVLEILKTQIGLFQIKVN